MWDHLFSSSKSEDTDLQAYLIKSPLDLIKCWKITKQTKNDRRNGGITLIRWLWMNELAGRKSLLWHEWTSMVLMQSIMSVILILLNGQWMTLTKKSQWCGEDVTGDCPCISGSITLSKLFIGVSVMHFLCTYFFSCVQNYSWCLQEELIKSYACNSIL